MKRYILQKLQAWKSSKPRKPLILNGVRQCGKTYILAEFGQIAFPVVHHFNFEEQKNLAAIFDDNLTPKTLLQKLSFIAERDIDTQHDLVIFDEIQACPNALTSLKYFAEQMPDLAIACAGSLLGLSLGDASYPVGKVREIALHPMTFGEFLLALDDSKSLKLMTNQPWDPDMLSFAHAHIWDRFTSYLVTGGLPEVVKTYVEHADAPQHAYALVRKQQRDLLNAYFADIAKHAGKVNAMHIERVLDDVPRQLARTHNSQAPRFQFKDVVPGLDRYQHFVGAIDWLIKTGLVIKVPLITHCELPLNAYAKQNLFKLYCFDVGLLGAMNNLTPKTIIDFQFGTYKGYMAENFVAQMQNTQGQALYCWQQDRAEVEFVCEFNGQMTPLEVKAGQVQRAKSLDKFISLYQPNMALLLNGLPFSDNGMNSKKRILPLYLAEYLNAIFFKAEK
jgi:uncharacterized protein